jgi:hypothetical protein
MNHTPNLPGFQTKRARTKAAMRMKDEGLGCLKGLFGSWLDVWLLEAKVEGGRKKRRKRVYDSTTTFTLFLLQILGGFSCADVVELLCAAKAARGKEHRHSSGTGGYCQARKRLNLPLLRRILDALAIRIIRSVLRRKKFLGFDVVVVDGTGIDAPDTKRNRKSFPPCGERAEGTSFPQLRLAAAFDLLTGAMLRFSYGDSHAGEQMLWKGVFSSLEWCGKLLLGDTYYTSYGNMCMTLKRGGQFIFPMKSTTKPKRTGGRRGDRDVKITKPKTKAKSWTQAEWDSMPDTLNLRLVETSILEKGFRTRKLSLLTSLKDRGKYPAEEIIAIQARRWDVELDFKALKTTMGMDHLSCKTPAMVEKEILMHMIAYNLVRALMLEAAQDSGKEESAMGSFSAGLACASNMAGILASATDRRTVAKRLADFRRVFLSRAIGKRRTGRSEPRALKRRAKPFPKMTRARHDYPQYRRKSA